MRKTLFVLSLFCVVSWLLLRFPIFEKPQSVQTQPEGVLGPFTIQQKILLGYPLSLNELSAKDWESLPKIGPKKAEAIIQYRQSYGPFRTVDDLLNVKGIGPKIVEAIRQLF